MEKKYINIQLAFVPEQVRHEESQTIGVMHYPELNYKLLTQLVHSFKFNLKNLITIKYYTYIID